VHEDLVDVQATDLAVTALARRTPVDSDDAALCLLQAWAADIDAHPVAIDVETPEPAAVRRRPRGTTRSVVAMTVALTLSSTGIAAAVRGDPFAPFNYVVDQFGHFAQHDRTPPANPLGMRNSPGDLKPTDAQARAERDGRPSRSREPRRQAASDPSSQASAPIVAHRVPRSGGGAKQSSQPRERHRTLVVRHPGGSSVDGPKPGSGETPPDRPESPLIAGELSWPKPSADEPPAPPDEPTSSESVSAPVR
jgi:hypothetical protein